MRRLVRRAATLSSQERIRYEYTKDFRGVVAADGSWFDADFDRVGLHSPGAGGGSDANISANRHAIPHCYGYGCATDAHGHRHTGADAHQHAGSADVHTGAYIYAQAAAYGYAAAHSNPHARADRVPRARPARPGRRVLSPAWKTETGWNETNERGQRKSENCPGLQTASTIMNALMNALPPRR